MKRLLFCAIILLCMLFNITTYARLVIPPVQLNIRIEQNKQMKLTIIPYDEKIYLLGYQTFLANRNIKEAFLVAEAAVVQRPDDLEWRGRLAQVASWNNKPRIALEQWIYIAKHKKDLQSIKQAIKISGMLRDHKVLAGLYQMQIALDSKDEAAWKGFISAKESLGDPQAVIKELKKRIKVDPQLFYFEGLAAMYQATGQPNEELNTLNEAEKRYGILPKIALRQAEILSSQGRLKEASKKLVAAYPKVKDNDYNFLRTFGQISWLVQDQKNAKLAYEKLVSTGEQDQTSLINLIQMIEESDPNRAFTLAYQGWKKYKEDYFLVKTLGLGGSLNQWDVLSTILSQLSKEDNQRLMKLPYYVSIKAKLLLLAGRKDQALALYQKAIQNLPDALDLRIDYLWFLIDSNYKLALQSKLKAWQGLLKKDKRFYPVFAAAFIMLNQPEKALRLYQMEVEEQRNNPVWLLNVADALNQMNKEGTAARVRQYAWFKMLKSLRGQAKTQLTKTELINLARVSMTQAPGNFSAKTISELSRYYSDKEASVNMLVWALTMNEHPLAEHIWHFRKGSQEFPDWIQQTLGLLTNDRYLLKSLLEKRLATLPYRDRVLAAMRVGNERLAQTLAYRGMAEHPNDSEMYKLMKDTQLASADKITIGEAFANVGVVRGMRTNMLGKIFITPRVSLSPWANVWYTKTMKKTTILTPKNVDKEYGFALDSRYNKGYFKINVSQRRALSTFLSIVAQSAYRLSSKLNTVLSLGFHQRATETTALLLAGMKNEASLSASYRIDQHNTINGQVQGQYFESQDGVYLGNGKVYSAFYNHKFALGYPDWNVTLHVSVNRYQDTGEVSGLANEVVPGASAGLVTFFVPRNFVRYGVSFGFGQAYRETYTHRWRPYATVDIFNNNRFGFGATADVGIAGHVFGRDHLVFYANRGTNVEAQDQSDYTAGAEYSYYF